MFPSRMAGSMNFWKLPSVVALGCAVLSGCSESPVATAPDLTTSQAVSVDAGPGRYLVVFRSANSVPSTFNADVAKLGGTVDGVMKNLGAAVVSNINGASAAKLGSISGVQSVDLDQTFSTKPRRTTITGTDASLLDVDVASPDAPHTATFYSVLQWNMQAINAKPAWVAGKVGSPAVKIGVIDTGIDEGSPTVAARRNIDLLGRIDKNLSRSFMPVEDTVVQRLFPGVALYTDLDGHGTNVASQISSNAFNFSGVTSKTTLVALKACTILPAGPGADPGYCSTASVFQAIDYAIEKNLDVINMSLGGGFLKPECQGCTSIFNRVIGTASRSGVTIVVAAGNEATDLDHDKNFYSTYCSTPGLICVAATGAISSGPTQEGPFVSPDAPAIYSNYGRSAINVAAPGGNYSLNASGAIVGISYVWSLCPRLTAAEFDEAAGVSKAVGPCSIWGYVGTSQASPHVAGLAALLVETHGRNPNAIRNTIERTADKLGASGNDPHYGKGRINVARALGVI